MRLLKDDASKVLRSICQHIWETQQRPQDRKMSVFTPIPKKGHAKKCSNCQIIALISHANKVMFKILQARVQQHVNQELSDVQTGFRKGRGIRIKWPTSVGHRKSKDIPEKAFTSASLTILKPLTVCVTTNCGKFFKRQEYQTTLPVS